LLRRSSLDEDRRALDLEVRVASLHPVPPPRSPTSCPSSLPAGTVDDIPKSRANYYAALRTSPGFRRAALSRSDYRALALPPSQPSQPPPSPSQAPGEHAEREHAKREREREHEHDHERLLVYCDPPYRGTTGYATGAFDHDAFWETARAWSRAGAVVLVSEYAAPPDWPCVASRAKPSCLAGGHKQTARVERLFVHESRRALVDAATPPSPLAPA
jgi:hypothetical protein